MVSLAATHEALIQLHANEIMQHMTTESEDSFVVRYPSGTPLSVIGGVAKALAERGPGELEVDIYAEQLQPGLVAYTMWALSDLG